MDSIEEILIKENNIKTICHIGSHIGLEAEKYYELGVKRVIWVEGNYRVLNRLIKNTTTRTKNAITYKTSWKKTIMSRTAACTSLS